MSVTIDAFRNLVGQTMFGSRDVVVSGQGKDATAKLGNFVFSAGKATNNATMKAFKEALEKEYGALGTHAFDTVVGSRSQLNKSLRACDIQNTLSKLQSIREWRFIGELSRQLDTSPKILQLPERLVAQIRRDILDNTLDGCDLAACKTPADVAALATARIDRAIKDNKAQDANLLQTLGPRERVETSVGAREATGLKNLNKVMGRRDGSVEDQVKKQWIGAGMRVNRSDTNPFLLEKLKTNGVEPGFNFTNDWSKDDTRGMMADINSDDSRHALDALKQNDPALAAKCEGRSLRDQIMLAGRAHPAGMAAVAEFVLMVAAAMVKSGHAATNHPFAPLAKALEKYGFSAGDLDALASGTAGRSLLTEAKRELFAQIRDAVMGVKKGDDFYGFSPIFKHFEDRHILKLDYNENDRVSKKDAAHAGSFQRPERILTTRKPILGQIYRLQTAHSADSISAGAVTEALANDLTRIAGVPSQELQIVRGEYSDGHPKLMLQAKFADGYKDMEAGFLKDGRVVSPDGKPLEKLGKYKAFFLATADRDAVGRRGQNKGFANGRFFAIDPGHSLEGNGKYLEVSDDLSFKDTYGRSTKPRFENFSVFDDDTFFSKFSGVLELRDLVKNSAFKKVFNEYRTVFDDKAPNISDAEKALRTKILAEIDKKEAEFNESIQKLLDVSANNLEFYDDLDEKGPAIQKGAIETIANLEKLTSPTTWTSRKGKVALDHLEVIPETRVRWTAGLRGDDIAYYCDTKMSWETRKLLENIAVQAGAKFESDDMGFARLLVPKGREEAVFAAFSEENVQKLTHPEEYMARKEGGDPLANAKIYKPVPYTAPKADPRPLMDPEKLPASIKVPVRFGGQTVSLDIPKTHFADLLAVRSSVHRPRDIDELRYLLESQFNRGNEILGALMAGKVNVFRPTRENIVALTYALHASALRKGEYMYRGSFSVEDRNGCIARWLDRAEDVYLRTSTHAKPYQSLRVDGHLNMPRGYDVPTGAGGMLNGMRTFHYFTVPDTDHLGSDGGSGPRRRLFFKCETYGIYASTAHFHPYNKAAAKSEGMKTRGYRFGDVIESIQHGSSLIRSFFTPKEAVGIRKENLTTAQKAAITKAENRLQELHLGQQSIYLTAENVMDGGGIKKLMDNVGYIIDHAMPEDEAKRTELLNVIDELIQDFLAVSTESAGDVFERIGNEIMINAKDLM